MEFLNCNNNITRMTFYQLQPIVIIENQPSSSAHSSVGGSHGNASCRPKDFLTNVITINNQVWKTKLDYILSESSPLTVRRIMLLQQTFHPPYKGSWDAIHSPDQSHITNKFDSGSYSFIQTDLANIQINFADANYFQHCHSHC